MNRTGEAKDMSRSTRRQPSPSDEEWETMKSMVSDQLDNVTSNLDELRANGSLETIAQMIRRGDTCPSARLQAWYHAMLEVEYCNRPYSTSQKLQDMFRIHATNTAGDAPQSFILDTAAQPPRREDRKTRPVERPQSVIARFEGKGNLSVVERQELWLAKKNAKQEKAQSLIRSMALETRAKSAPDLSRSRRSFSMRPQESKLALKSTNTATNRRSTLARKRSITSAAQGARSLGNITNQTEPKRRKRLKKAPITDPFAQKKR